MSYHYDEVHQPVVAPRCEISSQSMFELAEAINHLDAAVRSMIRHWEGCENRTPPLELCRAQRALAVLRGTHP